MTDKPEVQAKSGGGMQTQLAVTMAQALAEIAAGVRYLVLFGQRMQENKRIQSWRWRSGTGGDRHTFEVDHPVQFWTISSRYVAGGGVVSIMPGLGDAPLLDFSNEFRDLGVGGVYDDGTHTITIPTPARRLSITLGANITNADILVVAHNGGFRIDR